MAKERTKPLTTPPYCPTYMLTKIVQQAIVICYVTLCIPTHLPKETWRRTAERERAALGFGSWSEAAAAARDRAAWRGRVSSPIPT